MRNRIGKALTAVLSVALCFMLVMGVVEVIGMAGGPAVTAQVLGSDGGGGGDSGGGGGGGTQHLQIGNFRGGQQTFFNHGGFLALVKQLLAVAGGIDIQKQQHHEGDADIDNGIAELGITVPRMLFAITSGNNNQRPTSS